ncbi:hypothetical protein PPL_06339 [Heterostelium album PN500]|uniref:Uncharacterized protein n=1 Tax=Heterostelium pallidum (strain ATCC 26659 / Pp 5 / PN500) TaxID=670386 RepID=D3BCW1_HETP5|nr:hypothetical protein PPL_06339 [Heterostelium album PN500]EFA80753.1 hypothetical protein PPL_06339 [Heterostelium album PN500]|eukprot:XP_020432873.1 hypothetical protein PPL_06339 [Heterostelium album PN500]
MNCAPCLILLSLVLKLKHTIDERLYSIALESRCAVLCCEVKRGKKRFGLSIPSNLIQFFKPLIRIYRQLQISTSRNLEMFILKYLLLTIVLVNVALGATETALNYQIRPSGITCAPTAENCKRFIATQVNQGAKKVADVYLTSINFVSQINKTAALSAPPGELLVEGYLRSTAVRGETFYRIDTTQVYRLLPLIENNKPSGTFFHFGLSHVECSTGGNCPYLRVHTLNTNNLTNAEGFINPYEKYRGFPRGWLEERFLDGSSAAVSQGSFVNNKIEITGVYVNLFDPNPVCPPFTNPQCSNAQVATYMRSNRRCLSATGCVTPKPTVCPKIVYTCEPGYRLVSFAMAPNGCYSWYCDADFLPKTY